MCVYILGKKKFTSNAKRKIKPKIPKILRPRSYIWNGASQNTFLEERIYNTFKRFLAGL